MLNGNSFVLRLRYLQILFPPWFPLFQQPILCSIIGIYGFCGLQNPELLPFAQHRQIHLAIQTNTFLILDKYSRLYCVPLLGFMVSVGFKIQSYCPLFSLYKGRICFPNHKSFCSRYLLLH